MTSPGGQEVGRISIRAVPDTSRFRRELLAKLEAIENSLHVDVPVDPDTKGFRAKVKAATSNLPDAKVKVRADIDRSLSGDIARAFSKIPSVKLGTGINPAGYAVIATALAATLAPAVGLITAALTALPGVLAAVAAPIAAISIGLDGMKKAIVPLAGPFEELKATMNSINESAFLPVFQKLAGIFPTLSGSLPSVSTGLASIADSMASVLTSPEGLSKIDATVRNIGSALATAAPGVGKFTEGMLGLMQELSARLPSVSEWLNTAGDSFSNWVKEITTVGKGGKSPLTEAFEGLGDSIRTVLELGGRLGEAGIKFLDNPENVEKMGSAFNNIANAMSRINDASAGFFAILDKIEKSHQNRALEEGGFGSLLKEGFDPNNLFGPNKKTTGIKIEDLFGGLNFGSLTGVLEGPLKELQASLPQRFSQIWATITTNAEAQLGAPLGAFFTGLWARITANAQSQFGGMWNGITSTASSAWEGVVGAVQGAISRINGLLQSVPGALSAAWSGLAGAASAAWNAVVNVVSSALSTIVSQVVTVGGQIVAEVQSWGGKVAAAAQSIAGALVGIGPQMIAGFLGGFRSAAAGAIAEVASWAGRIAAAARDALSIGSPSKVFAEIGANTVEGFNQGLDQNGQTAVDRARALAEQITQAMNQGLTGVDTAALTDQLKTSLDELELQRKGLKVETNAADAAGNKDLKKSLQDRMKEIQVIKDQLALQKDQLGVNTKQADSLSKQDDVLGSTLTKMMDIGTGFAQANLKQFQSDIGIEGGGALTTLADIGLGWGTQMLSKLINGAGTTIQVNSVDEALAAKQVLDNKKALQYNQRGPG